MRSIDRSRMERITGRSRATAKLHWRPVWMAGLLAAGTASAALLTLPTTTDPPTPQPGASAGITATTHPASDAAPRPSTPVPEPRYRGGESAGIVNVANLVYAGTQSSRCFSDHFLGYADAVATLATNRGFHTVKLDDDDLYSFPLAVLTGEGDFRFTQAERDNLRHYLLHGGFVLASAGCSSREWDTAFRREIALVIPEHPLHGIDMHHPIFHTVFDIDRLECKEGHPHPLETIMVAGRTAVVYSQDGLNDTGHALGCCCCGANEIENALEINVNILAYALLD